MQFAGADGLRPTLMTLELVRGADRDTVGTFNSNSVWEHGGAEPGPDMYSLVPFSPVMSWATGRALVYLSEGSAYEVKVFDGSAALIAIYRENQRPAALTTGERNEYRRQRLQLGDTVGDDVPFPERVGGYRRVVLSHEGALWAQWASLPSDELTRWTVWSGDGMTRRHVVLPDVRIEAVRAGKAYGHVENELGIQTVVVQDVRED